jgi:hypothetical protein
MSTILNRLSLANNQFLIWWDNALTGRINILKINTSDQIEFWTDTVFNWKITDTVTLNEATWDEVARTLNYTTNKAAGNDTGLLINFTDTASPETSSPFVIKTGGVTQFSVNQGGSTNVNGNLFIAGASFNAFPGISINSGRADTANTGLSVKSYDTKTNTSGQSSILTVTPTYNQTSGTASNTDLLINRTQTAVGSGAQLLIDAQVGSASKFKVSNTGATNIANNVWLSATDFAWTGTVNMFKTNESDEIELWGALTNVWTLTYEADSWAVTVMNMPVTSSAVDWTEQSFSFSLDSNPIFKIYSESDWAWGIQGERIQLKWGISVKRTDAGAGDYNPSAITSDYIITADNTLAARAITLSTEDVASGTSAEPRIFIIKDEYGNATTNNLTITVEWWGTIDWEASVILDRDDESITLYCYWTTCFIY